uniref:Uncharacterized protein n=1 Tax=Kalanchoe fedtschenkoi TaxID=63787 RepID=A0A7N0TK21_KALFE
MVERVNNNNKKNWHNARFNNGFFTEPRLAEMSNKKLNEHQTEDIIRQGIYRRRQIKRRVNLRVESMQLLRLRRR